VAADMTTPRLFWLCTRCQTPNAIGLATCRACGAMSHQIFNPPKVAGVCDRCGGELAQRADDTPETQQHRIRVYFEQTAPLIDYFRHKGLLAEVDGQRGIDEIQAELLDIVRRP